jgi:hypothetical protein
MKDEYRFDYAHLAPLEPAARAFCAMRQQDADEAMAVPHPLVKGAKLQRPAWHFAAENLLNLSMMLVALRESAQSEGGK